MKKILSLLLVFSMVLASLAACTEPPVEDVENSDGQQAGEQNPVSEDQNGEEEDVFDGTLKLVVDGASDYVIVRGENASPSEVTAANELQKYLKQISGAELPIVTDASEPTAKEIVVGKTNREKDGDFDRAELGEEGFVIKSDEHTLYLVGGEQRGSLYAVYEFLESYLGCGFYTVEVEKIPEMKTIAIDKIEEDKQIPIMEYRYAYWSDYFNEQISVKRKLNAWTGISSEYGGYYVWNPFVHTFSHFMNYDAYGAEHPEYFAHNEDGSIIMNGTRPQPCLSNPDVLQIAIDWVKGVIASTPNIKVVSVSQNDGGGGCLCAECQKVYAEENESYSGSVIRFVNAVADAIKDEYPDVKIITLAYQYTREVCVTKPADNVVVQLCTIECCRTHPLSECGVQTHKPNDSVVSANSLAVDIDNWSKICDTLYIWDYVTNFSEYSVNFHSFRALKDNIRFFADHNVKGVFEQGNGQGNSGEFGELRAFLISHLLWDPYMSDEDYYGLMDEFLEAVYGPGWNYLREYIDYRAECEKDFHTNCFEDNMDFKRIYENKVTFTRENTEIPEGVTLEMLQNFESYDWTPYYTYYCEVTPAEVMVKGYELFGKAIELAETDLQKKMLDKALIQVESLESYYLNVVRQQNLASMILTVQNALKGLGITGAEATTLKNNIRFYFLDYFKNEYAMFNKALAEKMLSYGIVTTKEHQDGNFFAYRDVDYSKIPRDW